jgi:ubiquinone/menaquinone biosynthesis C-methylase UbiE
LPFADEQFDSYLAPLSLQIVTNPNKMLSEALRVTKKGSKIAFSVWGRRENIQIYPFIEAIMERHGLGP